MHDTSRLAMEKLLSLLDQASPLRILDVGSKRWVEGPTYRDVIPSEEWAYVGMDLEAGDNVDVVAGSPFEWPFADGSFDTVISGQCIEHANDLPAWFSELSRVLKPGGLAFVIAPWTWGIHLCPHDYWRILPDGMAHLLSHYGGLEVLRTFTIDVRLGDVVAYGDSRVADLRVCDNDATPGGTRLGDFVLEGGGNITDVVVEGDCVGVGRKPANLQ